MRRIQPLRRSIRSCGRSAPCAGRRHARAGLAPLELVLNLPILLFVMALMIILGTAGGWKARTQMISRHAAWRSSWPRTGDNDAAPPNWPRSASMGFGNHNPNVFQSDPWADHPVVRGPVIAAPSTGDALPVNADLLEMPEGMQEGRAHIRRDFPIFKRLPPHEYEYSRDNVLLSGTLWQFRGQGIGSNISRRIPHIYQVDLQAMIAAEAERYFTVALEMLENYRREEMRTLTGGDLEIRQLLGESSPDFRPRLSIGTERGTIPALQGRTLRPRYCSDDLEQIQTDQVDRLVNRVGNVPRSMSDYYIGAYRRKIQELEDQDPIPPQDQALIDELEGKVRQLERFRASLSQR